MIVQSVFKRMLHRASLKLRDRGRTLRRFTNQLGFVYFGLVDQHDDEHSAIRGFTASLSHSDNHYTVGTYEGYDIRAVNRFDIVKTSTRHNHTQLWTILEVNLKSRGLPHIFFVPTGHEGGEYTRLYTTQLHLQPLNSFLGIHNHSPEFHGRYQILAKPTYSHQVENLFDSPEIVGIGAKFWPNGIEIEHDKLYVYITQSQLTKHTLEVALSSALWLARSIDER